MEFNKKFPTNAKALKQMHKFAWPDGVVRCRHCDSTKVVKHKQRAHGTFRCNGCGNSFTCYTNTTLAKNKLSPIKVLYTLYEVMLDRNGISAMEITHKIGCTSRTAFHLLMRVRYAFYNEPCKSVESAMETDDAYPKGYMHSCKNRKKIKKDNLPIPGMMGGYSLNDGEYYFQLVWGKGISHFEVAAFLDSIVSGK